jgi:hypothetical protein
MHSITSFTALHKTSYDPHAKHNGKPKKVLFNILSRISSFLTSSNKYILPISHAYCMLKLVCQTWNISIWRAASEFFEPWFYGLVSRDSISLSCDSIF